MIIDAMAVFQCGGSKRSTIDLSADFHSSSQLGFAVGRSPSIILEDVIETWTGRPLVIIY
jgi:GT2 family glycosyltransferase